MADMASMNPSPDAGFNIQVTGRRLDLGEAFRTRVTDELGAAIDKYFDRTGSKGGSGDVRVSRDGHSICVDMVLLLGTGQQLVARATAGDAHAAFDAGLANLEKQIRRYHRELTNHHPHNGGIRSPADRAPLSEATAALDHADDDVDETEEWGADGSAGAGRPQSAIIAETGATLKPMTVAMAAMELEAAEAAVVLFRNIAHGGVSAVYRRKDGNIGWIDPERAGSENGAGSARPAGDRAEAAA